jgi:polyhydroxyalkanoate synthase
MPAIPAAAGTGVVREPGEFLDRVRREVERGALRARTGIETPPGPDRATLGRTPRDLVWSNGRCELWRHRSATVSRRPPLLVVFGLVGRSYVLDLRPGDSFVEHLRSAGFDVFLLDWAPPGARHAGERLEDYADGHLPEAVRRTCAAAGAETVNLLAYCFGGVLALLYAAHHPDAPLRSLTLMATPVDFSAWGPWTGMCRTGAGSLLDETGNVPPEVMRQAFRPRRAAGDVRRHATLLDRVWNDEHARAYQALTAWAGDHVPFPGAAARQTLEMLVRENALMTGGVRLGGEPVSLRSIRRPTLTVIAGRDHLVPEPVTAPLPGLVGAGQRDVLRVDAGHVGLMIGRTASTVTLPRIVEFLGRHTEPTARAA